MAKTKRHTISEEVRRAYAARQNARYIGEALALLVAIGAIIMFLSHLG